MDERAVKRTWIAMLLGFGGFLLLVWIGLFVVLVLLWKLAEGSPTIS